MAESNNGQQPTQPDPRSAESPGEQAPVAPEVLLKAQQRLEAVSAQLSFKASADQLEVKLPPELLVETCLAVKNDLGYRMLMSVTAVDWKDSFELVYHCYRLDSGLPIVLRCSLPHEANPVAPSLAPIWAGAEFQEREIYDLMGVVFEGHPDLRRILLADDFEGHPLRKDFQQDPDYVLVPHLRLPGYAGAKRGNASTGRFLDG